MTENQATRALRAAVFTALAVPLAALGQVLLTGRALPLALVAVASAAVFVLATALSGTRRGFPHIAAVLVPVELLLNTAFNLGQDTCASAAPGHGVDLLVCGGGSVGGSSLLTDWAGHSGGWVKLLVLLVHLGLALVAAAWLRLGDRALTGLAEAVRGVRALLPAPWRALLPSSPLAGCPAALTPAPEAERPLLRRAQLILTPAPRRGPPALVLAG
ncbi:hypothetical protein OG871_32245 [Kitasatospora sp. NBC_00374]|uniref:hypothetical protein n=1 Tax=Kitasatospora sp. NBC_00374 TaxID=2975964 RepID=UPI0032557722